MRWGVLFVSVLPCASIRTHNASRIDIPPCHHLFDFVQYVQYSRVGREERTSLLEAEGCEPRQAPDGLDRTCPLEKLSCAGPGTDEDERQYMCCNYAYMSRAGPEITSMHGDTYHIWKTGMSTLVQIPRRRQQGTPKLLVEGNVQPYMSYWETLGCDDARIAEVTISGNSVGEQNVTIRSGGLESDKPFAVQIGNGDWQEISWKTVVLDDEILFHTQPEITVTGMIAAKDPGRWGPDALVVVKVGALSIEVVQHTEGRDGESRALLDVSLIGTYSKSDGVGGWCGMDGASLSQGTIPFPCMTMAPTSRTFRSKANAVFRPHPN